MAYQNVGTPRFFIDNLLWFNAIGLGSSASDLFTLNPASQETFTTAHFSFNFTSQTSIPNINYLAFLGHSSVTVDNKINGKFTDSSGNTTFISNMAADTTRTSVNMEGGYIGGATPSGYYAPYEGFSIAILQDQTFTTPISQFELYNAGGGKLGAFSIGTYYEMLHSPNLSLTMTREMDGVKRVRTRGGADLVNYKYTKPAMWGSLGAWELGSSENQELSRSGRRVWDLSFNSLQDSDIFPMLSSLAPYGSTSATGDAYTTINADDGDESNNWWNDETLLDDNTFYNQVIHKTNGGQLPFIFQPNKDDITQFAICKFDMKEFKFDQVANGVYNVKLKIREVW